MGTLLKLYITRHGETVWNAEKRLQGWKDSQLTENGIHNAKALGSSLKGTSFVSVYASPSDRTVQTAKYIMDNQNVPLKLDDRLKEINMGDWEGLTQAEVSEYDADLFHAFWNTPHLYVPVKGEGFFDVQKRAMEAISMIRSQHESGNILVVTHTVVIKCLLAYFKRLPIEKLWEPPYIHDTSLTVIELSREAKIILEGDISHRIVTAN
jgi:broad specificity phosphatase PhoE